MSSRSIRDLKSCAKAHLETYCSLTSTYAWPTYDRDDSPGSLSPIDVLATSFLNYPIPTKHLWPLFQETTTPHRQLYSEMEAFVSHPGSRTERFEELSLADITAGASDVGGDRAWHHLLAAWEIVNQCPGLTMVGVTKVLHRKAPQLVPIVDSKVAAFYGASSARRTADVFTAIHQDVSDNAGLLDTWARPYTVKGVSMSRLRALDIAIWMHQHCRCSC